MERFLEPDGWDARKGGTGVERTVGFLQTL